MHCIVLHSEEQCVYSFGIQSNRRDRMMSNSAGVFFNRRSYLSSYVPVTETVVCSDDNLQVKRIVESLL